MQGWKSLTSNCHPVIERPPSEIVDLMAKPSTQRRHDLDALRAFAMLLGIGLHAALSFAPFPWTVQDVRQHELFSLFFVAVHGFRMQLFFLVSGFFTVMLWRRYGVKALLKHRFKRVFIPCLLGLMTIIPALHWVSNWALTSASQKQLNNDRSPPTSLVQAIRQRDPGSIERLIAEGADLNAEDAEFGVTMLGWAALLGDEDTARLLIEKGADVQGRTRDGSSALHAAMYLGHPAVVQLLLSHGADPEAQNNRGERPLDNSRTDWETTQYIAGLLRVPLRPEEEVRAGQEECRKLLPASADRVATTTNQTENKLASQLQNVRLTYAATLSSERLRIRWSTTAEPFHLILTSVFDHLWFLWFLCWLVPFFAVFVTVADRCGWKSPPSWLVLSPVRYCWLLPLTLLPQLLMGTMSPSFGPDTSVGVLPQPHLLLYYGLFFAFGALYFDCDDSAGRLGRWWWLTIPVALIVFLPAGLATISSPALSGSLQVGYAWLMTFGMIGLFRRALTREYAVIRYVSDSSYWLYVAHLPLVIAGQHIIRDWPIPSGVKFTLLCTVVIGILLVSYQTLVRNTWLGALLNGRRYRPQIKRESNSRNVGDTTLGACS